MPHTHATNVIPDRPANAAPPASGQHRAPEPPQLLAAHAAAQRGWPVFPLHPHTKIPAIERWETTASTDPGQLHRWWSTTAYNIGIACGPAALVVIDLDTNHGQPPPLQWRQQRVTNGLDMLAVLATRAHAPLPTDTYTVSTPSGGRHLYFQAPPHIQLRNTAGFLGWRIDTRAHGGYIVAAGSALRRRGHTRPYQVIRAQGPTPLPGWLLTLLTPPPEPTPPRRPDPLSRLDPARAAAYAKAALTNETTAVTRAKLGRRNHTLFVAAARLGELIGAGVLPETTATEALLDAARHHIGTNGFTTTEAHRTIHNGLTRGRRHPRQPI